MCESQPIWGVRPKSTLSHHVDDAIKPMNNWVQDLIVKKVKRNFSGSTIIKIIIIVVI